MISDASYQPDESDAKVTEPWRALLICEYCEEAEE